MIVSTSPGYCIFSPTTGKYVNPNCSTLLSSVPKIWTKIGHVKAHLNIHLDCNYEVIADPTKQRIFVATNYLWFPNYPYDDPGYKVYETTTGAIVLDCNSYIKSKAEKQIKKHGGKYVDSPKHVLEYVKVRTNATYTLDKYLKDNNLTEDQLIKYKDLP